MNAFPVSLCALASVLALSAEGYAQSSASRPEVVSITGIGIVLPRELGSKNAPDISMSKGGGFALQSAGSTPWISESAGTTGSVPAPDRRQRKQQR